MHAESSSRSSQQGRNCLHNYEINCLLRQPAVGGGRRVVRGGWIAVRGVSCVRRLLQVVKWKFYQMAWKMFREIWEEPASLIIFLISVALWDCVCVCGCAWEYVCVWDKECATGYSSWPSKKHQINQVNVTDLYIPKIYVLYMKGVLQSCVFCILNIEIAFNIHYKWSLSNHITLFKLIPHLMAAKLFIHTLKIHLTNHVFSNSLILTHTYIKYSLQLPTLHYLFARTAAFTYSSVVCIFSIPCTITDSCLAEQPTPNALTHTLTQHSSSAGSARSCNGFIFIAHCLYLTLSHRFASCCHRKQRRLIGWLN